MATDFIVSANTNPAIAALDKLVAKVGQVHDQFKDKFDKINGYTMALGASLIATGLAVAHFADEITDLAKANELSVGSVLALSEALAQNGGSADNAGKILQKFNMAIEDSNSGNLKLVDTFHRLGISTEDLGNKSVTALMDKMVPGFQAVTDAAERNALAQQLFGKSIAGTDIIKFLEDQKKMRAEMEQFGPALKTAGDAYDRLGLIAFETKLVFAKAFEPLFKFIAELSPGLDSLSVKFAVLAAALAVMTGASVLVGLMGLIKGFGLLSAVLTTMTARNPWLLAISGIVAAGTAIAAYVGVMRSANKVQEELGSTTDNTKRSQVGLNDALKKEKDSLGQIRETLDKNWKLAQAKFELDFKSLDLSEAAKKSAEAKAKVEEDSQNALFALQQKFEQMDTAARARNKATYEAERKAILVNTEIQKQAAEEAITQYERKKATIDDLTKSFAIWNTGVNDLLQNELKIATATQGNSVKRIELENQVNEVVKRRQLIFDAMSKLGPEDQLKISQALQNSTLETSNLIGKTNDLGFAFDDAFRSQLRGMNVTKEGYRAVTESISAQGTALSETTALVASSQKEIYKNSRLFETGWSTAFNTYVENATNAAEQAKNVFNKFTQSMEDTLFTFFKTGKFEWKNFIQSMVDELLKSQIKQLIAKTFTMSSSGGGGGGSFLGNLLGFADGGMIPTNGPVLVGERGPEILSGAGGRSVTPNGAMGGNVTYNINAVDALSFKQMIAQDPSFLYAVSEQGRRRIPGAR
jgi:hypothetical protein